MTLHLIQHSTRTRRLHGRLLHDTTEALTAQTVNGPVTIPLRSNARLSDGLQRHHDGAKRGRWQQTDNTYSLTF